jgi:predicted small secreted protein
MDDFDDILNGLDDDGDFGDLDLDFGDDNETDPENENELSGFDSNEPDEPRPPVDKKRRLIIGGIGLAIVIVVFTIAGLVKASREKGGEVVYENETIAVNPSDSQVKTVETPVQQPIQQQVQYNEGWTTIDADKNVDLSSEVSGVFTVTSVKHMARSNGNETEVKTIVSGSISGLTGKYELELPYSLARFLTVGNTLKLKYKIGQINGNSIISDLKIE